jgi:2-dehydropantoate 2-reductase
MKIAILGAGAMGSVYGALLARAGNEVWLIDRRADHMQAVRRDGLRVTGATGDWRAHPRATTDPDEVGACDLVVVATKGADLADALKSLPRIRGEDGAVLSIQNGLGAEQQLARAAPLERAYVGIAGGFGASIPSPGHVHHNGLELVSVASLAQDGLPGARAIADLWAEAGFRAKADPDVKHMIWSKLICNAAFSAVCCVTGLRIGEVLNEPDGFNLAAKCAGEATEVARALGIRFEFSDHVDYIRRFGERIPEAKPSLLLDRLEGKRGEIDFINGAVAREAEKLALPAPNNSALTELVRTMENLDLRPPLKAQPSLTGMEAAIRKSWD